MDCLPASQLGGEDFKINYAVARSHYLLLHKTTAPLRVVLVVVLLWRNVEKRFK